MTKRQAKEGVALLQEVGSGLALAEDPLEAARWIGLALTIVAGALLDLAHTFNPQADIEEDTNETTKN